MRSHDRPAALARSTARRSHTSACRRDTCAFRRYARDTSSAVGSNSSCAVSSSSATDRGAAAAFRAVPPRFALATCSPYHILWHWRHHRCRLSHGSASPGKLCARCFQGGPLRGPLTPPTAASSPPVRSVLDSGAPWVHYGPADEGGSRADHGDTPRAAPGDGPLPRRLLASRSLERAGRTRRSTVRAGRRYGSPAAVRRPVRSRCAASARGAVRPAGRRCGSPSGRLSGCHNRRASSGAASTTARVPPTAREPSGSSRRALDHRTTYATGHEMAALRGYEPPPARASVDARPAPRCFICPRAARSFRPP